VRVKRKIVSIAGGCQGAVHHQVLRIQFRFAIAHLAEREREKEKEEEREGKRNKRTEREREERIERAMEGLRESE